MRNVNSARGAATRMTWIVTTQFHIGGSLLSGVISWFFIDTDHRALVKVSMDVRSGERVALRWQSPRTVADPRLTVTQLVTEPLRSGGRRRCPPADELAVVVVLHCEQVGLAGELGERYPHEVSEGQLQRACLAPAYRPARVPDLRRTHLDAGRLHPGRAAGDGRAQARPRPVEAPAITSVSSPSGQRSATHSTCLM